MADLSIVLLALAIDAVVGDPRCLYRALPHPVALLGVIIVRLDDWLNVPGRSTGSRIVLGGLTCITVTAVAGASALLIHLLCQQLRFGWFIEALLASSLLAAHSLYVHVRAVALGLQHSLDAAQTAVSHIVGRDPRSLDHGGVARAAIESTAENFSDGVVAPLFWFVLLGLPGLAAYKAINTLDSMIGYRDQRYEAFGKFSARVDDVVNWVPARLAGALLVVSAAVIPGAQPLRAWRTMLSDAVKHRSINAGWQESAMAGALDFALAGPRNYPGMRVDDPWVGDGRRDLGAEDIHAALRLYVTATTIAGGLIALAWLVLHSDALNR